MRVVVLARAALRMVLTRTHTTHALFATRPASEFPLFLNGHAASEVAAAVDKGGLPASLFAMEDLHQKARCRSCRNSA